MRNRKPQYLLEFNQAVHNYLTREVSRPVTHITERFICHKCEGRGELYYTKGEETTYCDVCEKGIVTLEFTIKKV